MKISQNLNLTYFDTIVMQTVQIDINLEGLWALLMQNDRLIVYASKSLLDKIAVYAERRNFYRLCVKCPSQMIH